MKTQPISRLDARESHRLFLEVKQLLPREGCALNLPILDNIACNGRTFLHRAGALPKILGCALTIAAVVVTQNSIVLALMLAVQAAALFSLAPWRQIAPFALYPLLFTGLFAISQISSNPELAVRTILRGELAACAALMVIVTTPFPKLFATVQWTPRVIRDAVLLAYRSFFILIGRIEAIRLNLRLKGGRGLRGTIRNMRRAGQSMGVLTIAAMDMSERVYRVLEIRGYEGVLSVEPVMLKPAPVDAFPLALGAVFLAAGVLI